MAKSKGKKKYIFLFLLVLAGVAYGFYSKYSKRVIPVAITEEKCIRRNLTEIVVANGKIEPVLDVQISPEVSGEIIELNVKAGQHVKKGDLLLKIRPDNYLATRDSAKANLKFAVANKNTADANLERADLEYKRNKALFDAKLISESDDLTAKNAFDVAKTTLAGSLEQVNIAQAQLDSSEADLAKTVIYSPLDGTVSQLNSQLGERVVGTATMTGTVVMTIADLNDIEARVDVGEMDVPSINISQKAHLDVDSFKDKKFNGVVTEIARSANNNDLSTPTATSTTSTDATKFQVKIRVTEKDNFLPGMSTTANIETRYRTNVVSVPIQSVTTRAPKPTSGGTNAVSTNQSTAAASTNAAGTNDVGSGPKNADEINKPIDVVFVVEGDHVKMVPVKLGISDDKYFEITDGLKGGEEIVSGGYKAINRDLADGTKITLNKEAAGLDTKESKPN